MSWTDRQQVRRKKEYTINRETTLANPSHSAIVSFDKLFPTKPMAHWEKLLLAMPAFRIFQSPELAPRQP
jgi:hypothetical protein